MTHLTDTPSMRYTDSSGKRRTLTYEQAVALGSIGPGDRAHCSTTSIATNTALALAARGLIYLDGTPGDWTIQGTTPLGDEVSEKYRTTRWKAGRPEGLGGPPLTTTPPTEPPTRKQKVPNERH